MNNKEKTILTTVAITVLMIALVSGTFAYFSAQGGGSTSRNVNVTSNTTDLLTFQIANDISFTASTANFYQGGSNVSGSTIATATLVPNNKTNEATMNYYMYLNLISNPIDYSSTNTNEDPELLLQVFDGSNQLVTLTGLGSQVTVGGLTGYDITGQEGIITLLDNHTITANGSTTTENWRVVITLVNLAVDQNDNTNKTVTGEVIMSKTAVNPSGNTNNNQNETYVYWNDNFSYTHYSSTQVPTGTGLNGTYQTREQLATACDAAYSGEYPNDYHFADSPIYIKTTKVNGTATGHTACLWYNDREFCISPNYWTGTIGLNDETEGANTKAKLKADMENALGITIADSSCDSHDSLAYCVVGDFDCDADSEGDVCCYSYVTNVRCLVAADGFANCA